MSASNTSTNIKVSEPVKPDWKMGQGANSDAWKQHKKVSLDPYAEDRNPVDNYRLLVGAVTPRPIGFVSTVSKEGVRNLAPYSYFQVVNHDPPMFVLGSSAATGKQKDTCTNILETGECVINIITDDFAEAANSTCVNAPSEVDEWKLSGLTPLASEFVKAPHVAESHFSVECKLVNSHDWTSRKTGKRTGTLMIVEGVNFHIRENIVNSGLNSVDIQKYMPIARLGGNTYARVQEVFDMSRPDYDTEVAKPEVADLLK